MRLESVHLLTCDSDWRLSSLPHMREIIRIPDDEFDSDFDSAVEEDLLGEDSGNMPGQLSLTQHIPALLQSNIPTSAEKPPRSSTSSMPAKCVICNDALVYIDGPTCGTACASKLQAASSLPNPNKPRISDLPNSAFMSSAPPSIFDNNRESLSRPSERTFAASRLPNPNKPRTSDLPSSAFMSSASPSIFDNNWESPIRRTYADTTRSHSRPNQIRMCDVCHVRPRCQRGGKIYPTCGLSCAAKLHAPGSVEMCDYCKKRPKVVICGKMYPQCGKTCRDKAKLAETNAAVCISCILCWKSTKAGESDFCSNTCENLADTRAPFLVEIPRGHDAFKKVAEFFTSEWQTSKARCPTIKRVYMVMMKKSSKTSFEKYRTKIGSQNGILQRKRTPNKRWLVLSRECGFGDPGDLEPCSSNKCLLCSIVRSSFNRSDFPEGITTSRLNRAVEGYRSGKKSSSKIAALTHVVAGREAEMSPRDVHVVHPLPPQNTDSVHVIGVRNDGSRVDLGDIIVYDGNAVRPSYLISYE